MKLKYSVIGDNTPENREWLEKIGYNVLEPYNNSTMIKTQLRGIAILYDPDIVVEHLFIRNTINCIGNDALFRAVSALREDSDENQWLTNDRSWIKAENVSINDKSITDYSELFKGFHKATLSELQEHFKK